ncbi:MAG: circadian clock KaiB family protein [Gemmataceae bacterium]|nr:circadian clock KaiB family protein [Gemmataceae bacterium]
MTNAPNPTEPNGLLVLRLYVAGDSPNSLRAEHNLRAICQERLAGLHSLEIIDVLEEPLRLLKDGITATPTLVKLSPLPVRRVIGDLSNTPAVLLALGLNGSDSHKATKAPS